MLILLPLSPSLAENIRSELTIGIKDTKTLTLRPLLPQERDMVSVYDLVYESLISIDDDYQPQGQLAQTWDYSSNGKTWTFYLRPSVTFSDGTPLSALDVVASAQYILNRANDENVTDKGFYSNLKYFISSISATDESTVVIKTKRPYFGLLYAMTFPVVPAAYVDTDTPPGTGPYMFTAFSAGEYCRLEANPRWWKAQPQIRDIMFYFHDTQKKVITSYEYARVDAVFSHSIAAGQYKTGTSSLSLAARTNRLECLLMNNAAYELTPQVRKAIRYIVDPSRIISSVYSGMATATNLPFYPGTWMYNDSLSSYFVRNPDEAKRLIEEAGWSDSDDDGILDKTNSEGKLVKMSLSFYVYEEPENDVRVEAANMIGDMLRAYGIETRIETMSPDEIQTKLKAGSYNLALVSYAMDSCPDVGFLLMRGNTGNYTRYKSEDMTVLCEDLRKELYQTGFQQKLWDIQARFAEDCPFLCLYWRMSAVLSRYMYTTARDVREYELLRGIESFHP